MTLDKHCSECGSKMRFVIHKFYNLYIFPEFDKETGKKMFDLYIKCSKAMNFSGHSNRSTYEIKRFITMNEAIKLVEELQPDLLIKGYKVENKTSTYCFWFLVGILILMLTSSITYSQSLVM